MVLMLWGGWSLLRSVGDGKEVKDDGVFLVVLDPGHGGKDPGAMVGDVMEKDIDLAIALLVRDRLLEQEGVAVVMTRDRDEYPSLTERAELANQKNADLYVSIHANALENQNDYAGIYTFYHPNKLSDKAAAETIQAAVTSASGGIDRGIREEDYAVLRETDMTAVLIETGFMTCHEELAKLQNADYQKLLAQGIAQGILNCRPD